MAVEAARPPSTVRGSRQVSTKYPPSGCRCRPSRRTMSAADVTAVIALSTNCHPTTRVLARLVSGKTIYGRNHMYIVRRALLGLAVALLAAPAVAEPRAG